MGRHLDEGSRGSGVQVIFVSEIARSATVLHQPLIEPDDVKWRANAFVRMDDDVSQFGTHSPRKKLLACSVATVGMSASGRLQGKLCQEREWRGLRSQRSLRRAAKFNLFRDQARESSERPILSAFCRIAPSDLFKRRAIVAAGTFFRANDLSSRTCTDVQKRIFDPFFMSISMYER